MTQDHNFAASLLARGRAHPDRTALTELADPGAAEWTSVSYGDLSGRIASFSRGLAEAGIARGDRVVLMLFPSIESTAVYFGLVALGAVPVLIDPRMGLKALLACVSTIEPRAVIAVPSFHALLRLSGRTPRSVRLLVTRGRRWFWGGPRLDSCAVEPPDDEVTTVRPDDTCFVAFTSGSTGRPKAVAFTHEMVARQSGLVAEATGWREGSAVAMCFAGFVQLALGAGLTAVLPPIDFSRPGRAKPERVVRAIRDHECDSAFASPALWRKIVRHCEAGRIRLDSLRWPVTAGAPVPVELHEQLRPLIHAEGRLQTPYGATEAMPVTSTLETRLDDTWEETRRGLGLCVGLPVHGVDVGVISVSDRPIDSWSEDLEVPTDEIGEIIVRGPIVTPGYERDPSANERARIARDGRSYHRTGDLGRMDAEGRLWYCGRVSQRVHIANVAVGPVQLESVLNVHPGIHRTALVGVGPPGCQLPVVCVEVESGVSFTDDVRAELEGLLDDTPWSGMIAEWLPRPGFPVDARHNSKIRREALARWAARKSGVTESGRS